MGSYLEREEGRKYFCTSAFMVSLDGRLLAKKVSCSITCAMRVYAIDLNKSIAVCRSKKKEKPESILRFVERKATAVARHAVRTRTMPGNG
mmetsp:Transcript_20522/g.51031  ORF Transcript_20522/g.51031 Transcript_20522/m.51031 type:complete len:91 (+) Transcript_20522:2832-3104(+)